MNVEHVIRCNKINRYFVKWINEIVYIDIDDNGNAIDSSFQIDSESFNTLFAFVTKFKLNSSLLWGSGITNWIYENEMLSIKG